MLWNNYDFSNPFTPFFVERLTFRPFFCNTCALDGYRGCNYFFVTWREVALMTSDGSSLRVSLAARLGLAADAKGHGKLGGLLGGKLGDNRFKV